MTTNRKGHSILKVAQLLPRYRILETEAEREQRITNLVLESERSVSTPIGMAGADAARLRGIPAVSRGVGSAIPGTQPEQAVLGTADD
ncbi:MAG: hypothetical protein C5B48_02620 [Candidatus Rokuibacteriota bacterium]|nr:MAG: hypothetical protein C5B48_02620 [Candidatus Rokubacteria bacterium]